MFLIIIFFFILVLNIAYRSSDISATSNGTKMYAPPPVAPANKRETYKYHTSVAIRIRTKEICIQMNLVNLRLGKKKTKLTICGMAKKHKYVLRPIKLMSAPKRMVPKNPPKQNNETNHEISSVLNGPAANGARSGDSSMSKLTEGQPHDVP